MKVSFKIETNDVCILFNLRMPCTLELPVKGADGVGAFGSYVKLLLSFISMTVLMLDKLEVDGLDEEEACCCCCCGLWLN